MVNALWIVCVVVGIGSLLYYILIIVNTICGGIVFNGNLLLYEIKLFGNLTSSFEINKFSM